MNEIILGDAYELIKKIPDHSVDLIVTDPPYDYDNLDGGGIGGHREFFKEIQESGIDKGFDFSIIEEFIRVTKGINFYVWASKKQLLPLLNYMTEKHGAKFDLLIWKKMNPPPLCSNQYLHDCEYCLYFRNGVKMDIRFETASTVYLSPINQSDKKIYGHPTIKPQPMIENLIRNSCPPGGVVLDPFCGSGTTCAAAKATGRKYIGFEISEKWAKVARDRLEGVTKKEADSGFVQLKLAI